MLPKMILRLIQHLRDKRFDLTVTLGLHALSVSVYSMSSAAGSPEELLSSYKDTIDKAEKFLTLLQEFCDMGTAMRTVITRCLVNSSHYQLLTEQILSDDSEYANFMRRSAVKYWRTLLILAFGREQINN